MKRVYKKSFLIFFTAILSACLALAAGFAFAGGKVAHAEEPVKIYWGFDEDLGELTIYSDESAHDASDFTHSGSFNDTDVFSSADHAPWYQYRSDITSATVEEAYPLSTAYWFCDLRNLEYFDLSGLDTSSVTDMRCTFMWCYALESIDVSGFDTSNVTDMGMMFAGCQELTEIDLSNFDTSGVTDIQSMFAGCAALTDINLSSFDTSSVTNMGGMFTYCGNLTALDLSNFDTACVTNATNMFADMTSLESLTLGEGMADLMSKSNTLLNKTIYVECKAFAPSEEGFYAELEEGNYSFVAAEHTINLVPAVEPTCIEDGNIEHYACSVCGKTFEDEEGLTEVADVTVPQDPSKHDWVHIDRLEPTETEAGYTEHDECSICGETKDKETLPATGGTGSGEGEGEGDDPNPAPGTGSGNGSTSTGTQKKGVTNKTVLILLCIGVGLVTLMAILALILAIKKHKSAGGASDDDGFYDNYYGDM